MSKKNNENEFDKLFKSSTIINKPKKIINKRLLKELNEEINKGVRILFRNNKTISKNEVYVQCRLYLFEYFFPNTPFSHYILDSEIFDFEEIKNSKRKSRNKLLLFYLNHFQKNRGNGLIFRERKDMIEINKFDNDFKILNDNPNINFFVIEENDIKISKVQYNEFEILNSELDKMVVKEFNKLKGWWNNVLRLSELRKKNYNEYLKCIFLRINRLSDSKFKRWDIIYGVDRDDLIDSLLKDYDWNNFNKNIEKLNHLGYMEFEDYNSLVSWIKNGRNRVRNSKKFTTSYKSLHNKMVN